MAQTATTERLRALLARARNRDGGWPYFAGRQSRIEPTCWALLALGDAEAARLLGQWRSSGALLMEPAVASVNFAFNALAAMSLAERADAGLVAVGTGIVRALIEQKGVRVAEHPAIKQDTSLQGWSWSDGTFSWVEPTAWCTLAVKKLARDNEDAPARIEEAERLLRDRACEGGGWNYGNTEVYGQALRAHVPPSAAVVLALQDRPNEPMVKDAVGFLSREAPREGSTTALALTWMAMAAVGAPKDDLVTGLRARLEIAETHGNVASIAMMLYVLDLAERGAQPSALIL